MDLAKLALFDTILYCDGELTRYKILRDQLIFLCVSLDSGSMAFEEGGSRIDDVSNPSTSFALRKLTEFCQSQLKLIVSRVAFAASLFDDDGIEVRFMNSRVEGNGLRTEQEANNLVSQVRFSGLTPLGTNLNNKVLEPLVLGPARARQLKKPVLIIAGE